MTWYREWGDQLDFLLAVRALGRDVPVLESRPDLPQHLGSALLCFTDISTENGIAWRDFQDWADRHYIQDDSEREYLWGVLVEASRTVDKWHTSRRQQKQETGTSQVTSLPRAAQLRGGSTPMS